MARANFDQGDKVERIQGELESPQVTYKKIGLLMVAASREAFELQKFGPAAWRPRAVPNVFGILDDLASSQDPQEHRFLARPALIDSGALVRSIAAKATPNYVEVGSTKLYADTMHSGGPVESERITEGMRKRLADWLDTDTGKPWAEQLGQYASTTAVGTVVTANVPARPFVGLTSQLQADILEVVGEEVFEIQ